MQELTEFEIVISIIILTMTFNVFSFILCDYLINNKHSNKKQKPIKTKRFMDFRYLKMFKERVKRKVKFLDN